MVSSLSNTGRQGHPRKQLPDRPAYFTMPADRDHHRRQTFCRDGISAQFWRRIGAELKRSMVKYPNIKPGKDFKGYR